MASASHFVCCLAAIIVVSEASDCSGLQCEVRIDGAAPEDDVWAVELLQQELRISKAKQLISAPAAAVNLDAKAVEFAAQRGATAVVTTTPDPTGMTLNAEGDLIAFMSGLVANCLSLIFFVVIFSVVRRRFPMIYSYNVLTDICKAAPPADTMLGWARSAWKVTLEESIESIGLDNAMMLEFCNLCMRILAMIGMPMMCIIGPLNWIFGGNAAGMDHMSYLSFGNVENGSKLYWIHAFCVWFVVVTIKRMVFTAQEKFLKIRFKWLEEMPVERANTILVEGIPPEYQSDEKLRGFFEQMIPGARVRCAHVVKDTAALAAIVAERDTAEIYVREGEAFMERNPDAPRPQIKVSLMGSKVDKIEYYSQRAEALKAKIDCEKDLVVKGSQGVGGTNLSTGFVTFERRYEAEIAKTLNYTPDLDEWNVSTSPIASDIIWKDLTQSEESKQVRNTMGYVLVAGLYFIYMPLVIGITNIAKVVNMGVFQPIWQGLAPTMGLQVMVAFLPTILLLIFRNFFTLKADAYAQHKLQIWYFWFQIVFVILATAVGQDVQGFMNTLATSPLAIFGVMANTMPYATHFYMNFLVLQWVTHSMNLLRYIQLAKFKTARMLYNDEDAKALAEPEDQDYYGIGSRSARWTIVMTVGIVYGTLSPPINLLAWVNFAIARIVYGYLIVFAETRKPDLGGEFWVTMLRGLFYASMIYCVLMIGVLTERAASWGPMLIASPTLGYVIWSFQRFNTAFNWQRLTHQKIVETLPAKGSAAFAAALAAAASNYVQPELMLK